MLRPIKLALVISAVAACGPKGPQAGESRADSTASANALADSAHARDSTGPVPSTDSASSLRDSTATKTTTKTTSKAPRAEAYIGRDSAFGPTFTVDSTGKVTPIVPAKKKP